MDKVFDAALKRAEELQRELKILNDFIDMHRRTRQLLGLDSRPEALGTAPVAETLTTPSAAQIVDNDHAHADDQAHTPESRKRVTDNPKPSDVVANAVMIIIENEHPMTRRGLYDALLARGVEVKGVDPVKTLGTMLWRSGQEELVQLEKHGYWIRSEPYPPAGYIPSESRGDALAALGITEAF